MLKCLSFGDDSQVKDRLAQAGNPATRLKLSHLLAAAQRGIAQNPTATPQDLLVFVSGVLDTVVPAEAAAAKKAEAAAEAASHGGALIVLRKPGPKFVRRYAQIRE